MNNYDIENLYDKSDYTFIKKSIDKTLKYLNIKNSIFSVILVDDEKIHDLNKNYRNIDRVTDVISFAFEDNYNINDIMNIEDRRTSINNKRTISKRKYKISSAKLPMSFFFNSSWTFTFTGI